MDADVDFVQGYYFGRPAEALKIKSVETCTLMRLCEKFKNASAEESKAQEARIAAHNFEIRTCVAVLQADVPFEYACRVRTPRRCRAVLSAEQERWPDRSKPDVVIQRREGRSQIPAAVGCLRCTLVQTLLFPLRYRTAGNGASAPALSLADRHAHLRHPGHCN